MAEDEFLARQAVRGLVQGVELNADRVRQAGCDVPDPFEFGVVLREHVPRSNRLQPIDGELLKGKQPFGCADHV